MFSGIVRKRIDLTKELLSQAVSNTCRAVGRCWTYKSQKVYHLLNLQVTERGSSIRKQVLRLIFFISSDTFYMRILERLIHHLLSNCKKRKLPLVFIVFVEIVLVSQRIILYLFDQRCSKTKDSEFYVIFPYF